jgi:CRP/FNR family cyclic AMP-dependent transcriptional regulator
VADELTLGEHLRAIAVPRTFHKGEYLIRMGEELSSVLVIDRGRASVWVTTVEGDEMVLAVRGAGDIVGEFSVISSAPAMATVEALEPVEVCVVRADAYREFLRAHPNVMFDQLTRVVEMLRESDSRRLQLATLSLDDRVVVTLLALADSQAPEGIVTVPVTQEHLARMVSATRESVARVLARLRKTEAIQTERGRIKIADRDALRHALDDGRSGSGPTGST